MKKLALLFALSFALGRAQAAPPVSAKVGQKITITVTNDGSAPFTYAWTKNGVPIAAQTAAVIVIPSAALSDAGTYVCTVTNPAGSVSGTSPALAISQTITNVTVTITAT